MSPRLPFGQFCSFYLSKRKAGLIWLTENSGWLHGLLDFS